jgi:hypothetical protein
MMTRRDSRMDTGLVHRHGGLTATLTTPTGHCKTFNQAVVTFS